MRYSQKHSETTTVAQQLHKVVADFKHRLQSVELGPEAAVAVDTRSSEAWWIESSETTGLLTLTDLVNQSGQLTDISL